MALRSWRSGQSASACASPLSSSLRCAAGCPSAPPWRAVLGGARGICRSAAVPPVCCCFPASLVKLDPVGLLVQLWGRHLGIGLVLINGVVQAGPASVGCVVDELLSQTELTEL